LGCEFFSFSRAVGSTHIVAPGFNPARDAKGGSVQNLSPFTFHLSPPYIIFIA